MWTFAAHVKPSAHFCTTFEADSAFAPLLKPTALLKPSVHFCTTFPPRQLSSSCLQNQH